MSCPRVLVLGSINVDLVVQGPHLPRPGETVVGGKFLQAAGGKGANQAVAAARLSGARPGEPPPVALLGAVGADDLGCWSLAQLATAPLDLSGVRTVEGHSTGVALIMVDDRGENLISVASGANAALCPADIDGAPATWWQQARVLLVSAEVPREVVVAGLRRAKAHGLRTIVNPAPADPQLCEREVLSLIDVLTPNEHEAATLTGLPVTSLAEAAAGSRRLRSLGCGAVVVTLGPGGAWVDGEVAEHLAAPVVRAVDSTAAGDCFNGALAWQLAEGASLWKAARWATQASAISVTRRGAQPSLPWRHELPASAPE